MRALILGAGATGGYFGGRMVEAGADATFLVRERRRAQLAEQGLRIASPVGDFQAKVRAVLRAEIAAPYDLVIVSCKAYDLDDAIETIAPAVGEGTAILPLLNGMRHLERLDSRFGAARVLGGLCGIAATLDADGTVRQMGKLHYLTYGERDGSTSARVAEVEKMLRGVKFDTWPSDRILGEMWEKWVLLATLAAATCLLRGAVGDIVAASAVEYTERLLDEVRSIAAAAGIPPRADHLVRTRAALTEPGSTFTASMLRDLERGARVEADHILGDLLARGRAKGLDSPLLALAYANLKVYEARRRRET